MEEVKKGWAVLIDGPLVNRKYEIALDRVAGTDGYEPSRTVLEIKQGWEVQVYRYKEPTDWYHDGFRFKFVTTKPAESIIPRRTAAE